MKNTDMPILKILDIIHITRENVKIKTNNKNCYVLSCRLQGESLFLYKNARYYVERGDILFIPFGASYIQECEKEELICFHLEAYCNLSDKLTVFKSKNNDQICKLFFKASEEWKNQSEGFSCRCMAYLYEILSTCNIMETKRDTDDDHINNIINYIENHLSESDLSVEKICKAVNLSRTYFNKVFKSFYNTTPIAYINTLRVKKAQFLLESGNYTNEEIAHLCGFNDVKYFYVIFKKITNKTTKEFKNDRVSSKMSCNIVDNLT